MKGILRSSLLLAGLLVPLAGCGTVMNFLPDNHVFPGSGEKAIYGGVSYDVTGAGKAEGFWEALLVALLLVIDLPLSAGMDTVTLPITIPVTLCR
jgi:uncharacterized protein YceK